MHYFYCARCGKQLKVPDNWLGQSVRCPECEYLLRLPAPTDAPEEESILTAVSAESQDTLLEVADALPHAPLPHMSQDEALEELAQAVRTTPSNPRSVCTACGTQNVAGNRYCGKCGRPIAYRLPNY